MVQKTRIKNIFSVVFYEFLNILQCLEIFEIARRASLQNKNRAHTSILPFNMADFPALFVIVIVFAVAFLVSALMFEQFDCYIIL